VEPSSQTIDLHIPKSVLAPVGAMMIHIKPKIASVVLNYHFNGNFPHKPIYQQHIATSITDYTTAARFILEQFGRPIIYN
jgi:hypothetical protein